MSVGDKATRPKAVPFIAEPLDVTNGGIATLEFPVFYNTNLTKIIPLARPMKGDVVEAYLFMRMFAPSDKALNVRIGIGDMTSHTPAAASTYTDAEITKRHQLLTGTTAPFNVAANGTLVVEANLLRGLGKRGDTNFYQEAFALLVTFDSLPENANGYELNKFFASCSAQMGANR